MRKLLLGLAALAFLALAVPVPAEAGFNLRQNDDGTTEWVRQIPDDEQTHAVGSRALNAYVSDMSTAATFGVVSPLTYAEVTYIQHVALAAITGGDAVYTFFVADTDGTVLRQITGGINGQVTVTHVDGVDETGDVDTLTPSGNNTIEKDQVILINTDGGSTNAAPGMFTITVQPR